jgi:hypothetical protein
VNKVLNFKEMFNDNDKRGLWDHKKLMNVDKWIDKNVPTPAFER